MSVRMEAQNFPSTGRRSPQRLTPSARPQRRNNEHASSDVEHVHRLSASSQKRKSLFLFQCASVGPGQCPRALRVARRIYTAMAMGALVGASYAVVRDREIGLRTGPPRQQSRTRKFLLIHSTLCHPRQPRSSLVHWDVCLANCGTEDMTKFSHNFIISCFLTV